MNQRNTNQKKLILDTLASTNTHPTIEDLYELVRKKDNTIGIATVYRNVKKFVEENKVYSLKTKGGVTRYDYYKDHVHFECLKCNKIIDIYDDKLFAILRNKNWKSGLEVKDCNVMLHGYCNECIENLKIEEV